MKRARFVHEGQLAPPSGPEVYKEVNLTYNFVTMIFFLKRPPSNPAISSRSSTMPATREPSLAETQRSLTTKVMKSTVTTTKNIFKMLPTRQPNSIHTRMCDSKVRHLPLCLLVSQIANDRPIADILAPLTTVTELPTHPTLSHPYTTKTLTDLAKQSCNIMHKENAALWKVKHLQTRLVGDHIWAPCELMLGPNDIELYRDDFIDYNSQAQGSVKSDANTLSLEDVQVRTGKGVKTATKDDPSVAINDIIAANGVKTGDIDTPMGNTGPPADNNSAALERNEKIVTESQGHDAEGSKPSGGPDKPEEADTKADPIENGQPGVVNAGNGVEGSQTVGTRSALATNALAVPTRRGGADKVAQHSQARRETEHEGSRAVSVLSELTDEPPIHPLFLHPQSARPDRDLGIPEGEADDMRRLLQLYVQKQEEVCRGAKRLYEGLLRADRLRKTVLQWSKFEAHVGPHHDMSDGEDWYDKEEWGLEDDLKKGQDEEEEDTTQTTKKTRTRR